MKIFTIANLIRLLLLLLAIWGIEIFARPITIQIFNLGNAVGLGVCLLFALTILFSSPLFKLISRCMEKRSGKIAIISVGIFLLLCIMWAGLLSFLMARSATEKPSQPNTLIVLGCRVNGDVPSLALARRIDTATEYLLENPAVSVIVSGGQGPDEWISEAEAMKRQLIESGISEERIIMENKSTSTLENLQFSMDILEQNNLGTSVIIVTEGYHMLRAKTIAKKIGLSAEGLSASTSAWLLPTFWVREWFANTLEPLRG